MEILPLFSPEHFQTLTFLQEDFRAKLLALLEKDKDLRTQEALYFLKLHGFVRKRNQNFWFSKMFKAYLTTTPEELLAQSTEFLLTLAIPLNFNYSILAGYSLKIESVSSLLDILEENVSQEYFLSQKMISYLNQRKSQKKIQSQAKHHSTTITGKMRATDTYVSIPKIAGTLTAGANSGGLHSDMTIIEVGIFRTHEDGKGFRKIEKDICPTIPARARKDGSGQPVINVYSLQPRTGDPTKGGTGLLQKSNESYCLDTGNSMAIEFENKIRRLT